MASVRAGERVRLTRAVASVEPVRDQPGSEIGRPRWINALVGALVVVMSGLIGFVVWQGRGDQVEVWFARERIAAGTVLGGEDSSLGRKVVQADSVGSSIPVDSPVGERVLRIDVAEGGFLTEDQFVARGDVFEQPELSVVGLRVDERKAPPTLRTGDLVSLLIVDESNDTAVMTIEEVEVVDVNAEVGGGGNMWLAIAVDDDLAEQVAIAAWAERVLVIVTGRK